MFLGHHRRQDLVDLPANELILRVPEIVEHLRVAVLDDTLLRGEVEFDHDDPLVLLKGNRKLINLDLVEDQFAGTTLAAVFLLVFLQELEHVLVVVAGPFEDLEVGVVEEFLSNAVLED